MLGLIRKIFFIYATQIRSARGSKAVIENWCQTSVDSYKGLKWQLFHGIIANRREERLARSSDTVIPTRTLLSGVINIQPTTEGVNIEAEEIREVFAASLTNPSYEVPRLGHMLEDIGNFGVHDDTIKFRDGGSSGLERMLSDNNGSQSVKNALSALAIKHVG